VIQQVGSDVTTTATKDNAPSVAFVTVSYGPDRERCELLCRSLDELAPSSEHLIIVDRADLPQFHDMESGRRRVVTTEGLLPGHVVRVATRRLGLRSNLFLHAGKPIRGWLIQQLAKLASSREVDCDVIVHADSDVALLRPFDPRSLVDEDGRVRLYRAPDMIDESLPDHVRWHRSAENLLGLATSPLPLPDYITSLVPWRRANAIALLDFLDSHRRSWMRAIAGAWNFSEYMLYGRFVSNVLGEVRAGQFVSSTSLCRDYWGPEALSHEQIEELLDSVADDQFGVSITAKAGMPAALYAQQIERRWTGVKAL
jgi:hypothetical protein